MNIPQAVERDERTLAVENASYRWGFIALIYTLLVDVMCRSLFRHEAAWDLMALVIGGGIICFVYQARQKTLTHGWAMNALVGMVIAAVIAVVLAMSF